ncbi:hypothetical protein [Corallincola spongiicola]|uniref:STAS/SEC14 domain-containing protein n=1 Tax=Corallincola spongiicola TaxID=2520508 RepID=A0ABY1WS30_9GAMM|nr:hypothetical protein [Corallincola spongiicola]TAA47537.1 hypothetical protein EXY25_09975 [Corallincola spongiicola]
MEPHGYVELSWHDQLLTVIANESFNCEGIEQGVAQSVAAIEHRACDEFVRLEVLGEQVMTTRQGIELITAHYRWCLQHRAKAIAVVSPNANMFGHLFESLSVEPRFGIFKNQQQALVWLEQHLSTPSA